MRLSTATLGKAATKASTIDSANSRGIIKSSLLALVIVLSTVWTSTSLSSEAKFEDIKVTTFNIRWYGAENPKDLNERDRHLRSFISDVLGDSDVIVFQEIVDPVRLRRSVLNNDMYCQTYDDRGRSHQYVVLCHKKYLRFITDDDDDDFEIEEVGSSSQHSRPALHGIITTASGDRLFKIIGVHLKAFPDQTSKRLWQSEIIAKHIKSTKRGNDLPVIVTGDFNSHSSPNNERDTDDKYLIDRVFKDNRAGMELEDNHMLTFKNNECAHQLDLFFHSHIANPTSRIRVDGPCNDNFTLSSSVRSGGPEKDLETYNEHISDHCPVSMRYRFWKK